LPCERQTQIRLHKMCRRKIREWEKLNLIERAVLTYHYSAPAQPTDSLYLCLDISSVEEETELRSELSQSQLDQIPSEIIDYVKEISHTNGIKPRFTDYKSEIEQAKRSSEERGTLYYKGASVKDILHFASFGTKIAFEVLDRLEENRGIWRSDTELAKYISSRLTEEFGADYEWMIIVFHFVCNPLRIPDLLMIQPRLDHALQIITRSLQEKS